MANSKQIKMAIRAANIIEPVPVTEELSFTDVTLDPQQAASILNRMPDEVRTPFDGKIGQTVVVRTITQVVCGTLRHVFSNMTPTTLQLENASWLGDTGLWSNFLKIGPLQTAQCSYEYMGPEVFVNLESYIDMTFVTWAPPPEKA